MDEHSLRSVWISDARYKNLESNEYTDSLILPFYITEDISSYGSHSLHPELDNYLHSSNSYIGLNL